MYHGFVPPCQEVWSPGALKYARKLPTGHLSPRPKPGVERKSGSLTIVITKPATESLPADDLTGCAPDFLVRFDQPVAEALVVTFFVIVNQKVANGVAQGLFSEKNHTVPALLLY